MNSTKRSESAGGISPEQVMADALFRLAGGLSIELEKRRDFQDKAPIRPERKTGTAAK